MNAIEIPTAEYTAYAVHTLVNQILSELGVDTSVPPQMMYNYTRNGLIAKRTKGVPAKEIRYSADEVAAWLNKWFSKNYKVSDVATTHKIVDPFATLTGVDAE
jgi:hypothetical protein